MQKKLIDQRWPWLVVAGIIALVFFSTFVEIRPLRGWDQRPSGSVEDIAALRDRDDVNVLFVVVDTLRAERLGSYGYPRPTSPQIDRLADTGVRFERHLSQSSWTKASMASLWTGLYPARTGITRFDHVLPDAAKMPAEILQAAGFRTAGVYRNGWVAPTFGFGQGFEVYQKSVSSIGLAPGVKRENPTLSERSTDEAAVKSALEFLRVRGRERWFLYLHLMDLHEYIYDKESARFGSDYSDIYDNSILWTDRTIEVLLDSIADLGFLDNTLVILASDHGEAFGERGFEGHAHTVYRETTEVPLLMSFPFRLDSGIVVRARTRNIDIWPTVLDLLGLEMPGTDGRSRVAEILAAGRSEPLPEDESETAIAHLDRNWAKPSEEAEPTVSVAEGTLRYVRMDQEGEIVQHLFDSREDPRELRNRAKEDPVDLARMAAVADAYLETEPEWGAVPTRELSELELGHLRALGYVVR
jgi:arylsulfatase A-like enzyme